MKTITLKDNATAIIGEWFDKVNGNTYFDMELYIGDNTHFISYQYGYSNSYPEVKKELDKLGYKIKKNKRIDEYIKIIKTDKLKRELIKIDS